MSNFSIGEKVYCLGLGMWGILQKVDGDRVTVKLENSKIVYGSLKDCEKFIEAKFKVGQKFTNSNGWIMEIVKTSLNKKKGEYYYTMFDVKDGYAVVVAECQLDTTGVVGWREIKPKKAKKGGCKHCGSINNNKN